MIQFLSAAIVLTGLCSLASAQDVILSGHIQRVIMQPDGVGDCPPRCPVTAPPADGVQTVCVSNLGGCESMEVAVDQVFSGEAAGSMRVFKNRIGEWGPRFGVTAQQIVVSQVGGTVSWSPVTMREGRVFVDALRMANLVGKRVRVPLSGEPALVALEELIEQREAHP